MIADAIDEPDHAVVVPLLDALSSEEADDYRVERNVIELEGKSVVVAQELAAQHGFVGGTEDEYVKYVQRPAIQHVALGRRSRCQSLGRLQCRPQEGPPETAQTPHAVCGQLLVVRLPQEGQPRNARWHFTGKGPC